MARRNRPRQEGDTSKVMLTLPRSMKEKFDLIARICGVSTSLVVYELLYNNYMVLYNILRSLSTNIYIKQHDIPIPKNDPLNSSLSLEEKQNRGLLIPENLISQLEPSDPSIPPIPPIPPSSPKRKPGDPRVKELAFWWYSEYERCMGSEYPFKKIKKEYAKINSQLKYALGVIDDLPRLKRTVTIFFENNFVALGILWAKDIPRSRNVGVWYAWIKGKILDNPNFPDGEQVGKGSLPVFAKTTGKILEREIDRGGEKRKAALETVEKEKEAVLERLKKREEHDGHNP